MNELAVILIFLVLLFSTITIAIMAIMIVWDTIAGNYEPDFTFRSFRSMLYGLFKRHKHTS